MSHWDTTSPCPRWVKTTSKYDTEDFKYPDTLTEDEVMELPEHIGEIYEECGGSVRVHGYFIPGRLDGAWEDCYPDEGEDFYDECDSCGYEDWSDKEKKYLDKARYD